MLEDHEHKHAVHEFDGIIENRVTSPPAYFTVLFYGLIIWGIAFSAFYMLSGWSSEAEFAQKMSRHQQQTGEPPAAAAKGPETPAAAAAPAVAEQPAEIDGAALYAQHCAMCHGGDATGGVGPDLTTADYVHGKSPEAVTVSIAEGRPGGMPSFGNQLNADEIQALVDYLLAL